MKINIHNLLCNKSFRDGLAEYITIHVPELIECRSNYTYDKSINFIEFHRPNSYHKRHSFVMIVGNSQYNDILCTLDNKTDYLIDVLDVVPQWGYKMREGHKYPNLEKKVKSIITRYIREIKLKKIIKNEYKNI